MSEKIVLILAIAGVWSIAPDRFWGGAPALAPPGPEDEALRFFARLLVPIGLLVGIHIFWAGADEPGGAFQAGAILSAMWMINMISKLSPVPQINAAWLRACLIAGPLFLWSRA